MSVDEKYVLYGGSLEIDFMDDYKSLGQMWLEKLKGDSSTVLLEDAITFEQLTGSELRFRSIQLAQCLRELGIKAGDQIGICSENRLDLIYALFASFYLGATAILINNTYTEYEINHALSLTQPKIIFSSPNAIDKIVMVAKQKSYVQRVVYFGDKFNTTDATDYNSFVSNVNIDCLGDFNCEPIDISDNVAVILFSSGTTGLYKGVQITQKNIICIMAQLIKMSRCIATIGVIPWFHAGGLTSLFSRMYFGSKNVFLSCIREREFFRSVEMYKVQYIVIVPQLMTFLAKSPLVDEYDLSSLKTIFCASAPLSKEIQETVQNRTGIHDIRQGFGMTEGLALFTYQKKYKKKIGSVGKITAGMWGKVVNLEKGINVGPNEQGEIAFKGNTIMKGYVGNPEATRNTIDKDGWLYTGDIGYYDEDGDWFIVDRIKDLIKYNGYPVSPAELEGIIMLHTQISDVAVIGLPGDELGELPMAFVVKKKNANVTAEELIGFVAERVISPKQLRGGIKFIDVIPRNSIGKKLRKDLIAMATNLELC